MLLESGEEVAKEDSSSGGSGERLKGLLMIGDSRG